MSMRQTVLPVQLQRNLTKLIINLTTCLIYPLTCNKCRKQYVGWTVDTFRYRRNNYGSNSHKHVHSISCTQEHLYKHFCDIEHRGFLNDVSITFIDKTDPTNLLQREYYWKHTSTFAPYGLSLLILISFWSTYFELFLFE